ncbi:hypothetical protein RJG79_00785 [Mycoplasmatota bacterium WC44]
MILIFIIVGVIVLWIFFYERVLNAMKMIVGAFKFFIKHPRIIFPLFFSWLVITTIYLYVYFEMDLTLDKSLPVDVALLYAFILIFTLNIIVSLSSLILLELIEQLETTGKMSILKAIKEAFTKDLVRALPIIVVWSLLSFILFIIKVIIKGARKKLGVREEKSFSGKAAADVLSSGDGLGFSGYILRTMSKGIRMAVFTMLPAIAWEDKTTSKAAAKGWKVFTDRFIEMISGLFVTQLITIIITIPIGIIYYYNRQVGVEFTEIVWYSVVLFIGFTWSFGMLIEQLFTAELYLWYMKWEKAYNEAKRNQEQLPKFNDVEKPSFLDQVSDLI